MPDPNVTPNEALRPTLAAVRKELLDFGLRNPLLNYRLLKSKGLEVAGIRPADAFEALVTMGKELCFQSIEEAHAAGRDLLLDGSDWTERALVLSHRKRRNGNDHQGSNASTPNGFPTGLNEQELEKRLLATYYAAKASIEEQGVNTLFLALGTLLWREPGDKEEIRRAPLLLIPVELERKSAGEGFRLKYSGEDVVPNVCLMEFLKQSFGLQLNDQLDSEDLAVDDYFAAIEKLVSKEDGWSVNPDFIGLGFFSFAKFLMYRDLDPATWDNEGDLLNHDLLNKLLGTGSFASDSSQFSDGDFIDDQLSGTPASHVLDADSTQSLAILDVATGRSMVIQGPPGTGKSQTIVNLIAEAMASKKTVLFVAEKKAALEVVKQRLDKIGLGAACLELHSNKVKKKEVIDDLKRTACLKANGGVQSSVDRAVFDEAKEQLNSYCKAVNSSAGPSEETVHDLYGVLLPILARLEGQTMPALELRESLSWVPLEVHRKRRVVVRLQERLYQAGVPSHHPFWGTQLRVVLPTTLESIRAALIAVSSASKTVAEVALRTATLLKQDLPTSKDALLSLCATAKQIANAPSLQGLDLQRAEWAEHETRMRKGISAGALYQATVKEWARAIKPESWKSDVKALEATTNELGGKWWRVLSPRWKAAKLEVSTLIEGPLPKSTSKITRILAAIRTASECQREFESCSSLFSELYGEFSGGEASDWQLMGGQQDWITATLRGIRSGQFQDWSLLGAQRMPHRATLTALAQEAEMSLASFGGASQQAITGLKLDLTIESGIRALVNTGWESGPEDAWRSLAARLDELDNLVAYAQVRDDCVAEHLVSVAKLADKWEPAKDHLSDLFDYTRVSLLLEAAFQAHPVLARFDASHHNDHIRAFRQLDSRMLDWACLSLAQSHAAGIPQAGGANGQIGTLWREFEKKSRHLPIRKLILKSGNAIQAIKPIFMMSPLSVANFLPPMTIQFDLVIFDEASQVKPADALGAIVRAKQAVVVGDSKQLPPTSFFESMVARDAESEEDDAVATSDIESILGLFCSRGAHQRMLRWHYRSKHESLIAGSNHLFYENRLVVFPSPDRQKENVGLLCHRVENAHYDRSKTRTNPVEAKAVAEAVMKHAIEQMQKPKEHRFTLGVAALSVAQRDAILDQVEILRRRSPKCEEFFMSPPHEQFFVKNLENVQGDERDVIFISIGYGRTSEGYLAMSFGPVNRTGGERRLNVLFSRARRRCEVFTTLRADDIDTGGNDAGGVHALKSFLRYAESGFIDVPVTTGRQPDSPFEEQVQSALQGLGYVVHTQVGTAGFFIDLAVVDPLNPGRYLLGIECDGAAYHSARSTRDRDRLRQAVLESLGWRIHRIWSTAWFRTPAAEVERLRKALDEDTKTPQTPSSNLNKDIQHSVQDTPSAVVEMPLSPASTPSAPMYIFASFEVDLGAEELHAVSLDLLVQWLTEVIEVESPIHWLEAARRIANAAGVQRVGGRIQETFRRACRLGSQAGRFVAREGFLWRNNSPDPIVRDRSEMSAQFKKIELIAPEEIQAAIEQSISDSFGLASEDIAISACRLLGFARVSEDTRIAVEKLRDDLISKGRLALRGETIVHSPLPNLQI